jgi:hypothetical protein
VLTERPIDPMTQAKHSPEELVVLVVNVVMIALRKHVDEDHKDSVDESQYREINVCGALDAWSVVENGKHASKQQSVMETKLPGEYHKVDEIAKQADEQRLRDEALGCKLLEISHRIVFHRVHQDCESFMSELVSGLEK